MKVLVTGGTGFIGQHLVKRLLGDSHQVAVLTRNSERVKKLFGESVEILKADITEAESLKNIPKDFQWLFHLAAAVSYRHPDKETFYKVNVQGSRNILMLAGQMKNLKKIVYVSSVGVYGPIENPPADETWPHKPQNDYEISKEKGEQVAWRYIKKGLPANIIRPTLVYGPGDAASGMFGFIKAVAQRRFMKIGKKAVFMHPAYIENVVDALVLAAKSKVVGEDFIIGDEDYLALEELAKMIAKEFGVKLLPFYLSCSIAKVLGKVGVPFSSATVDFMTHHRAYNINKAKKLLDFRRSFSTKEGVKKTVNWYNQRYR